MTALDPLEALFDEAVAAEQRGDIATAIQLYQQFRQASKDGTQ